MTLRIGIVGAGANTQLRHIPGFMAIDGVKITAVCNRTRKSSQRVADKYGIASVHSDWKELVHSDQVDAVLIGTWPNLHCPIAIESLAAGKHVLTEARMAMSLDEAHRMHDASRQSDRVAMIVPSPHGLAAEPLLLKMMADGAFGQLLEIHVRSLGGAYNPNAPLHWRQRRDLSGDNIMGLGICNETVRRYAGDEKSVLAHGTIFTKERPTEDGIGEADIPESLGVVAQMTNGATAVYHLSSVVRTGDTALEFYGTRGAFKIGTGNKLNPSGAWIADASDQKFRPLEITAAPLDGWRVEEDFIDAIREHRPVTHTSFADGVKYMRFTEAVHRSMRQGAQIELPL